MNSGSTVALACWNDALGMHFAGMVNRTNNDNMPAYGMWILRPGLAPDGRQFSKIIMLPAPARMTSLEVDQYDEWVATLQTMLVFNGEIVYLDDEDKPDESPVIQSPDPNATPS